MLDTGRRIPQGWPEVPIEQSIVVVRQPRKEGGWRQEAADTGRPAILIVGGMEDVHPPQARATADRTSPAGPLLPEALEAAIRSVTGGHVDLEDHWPAVDFEDAVACLASGSTPVECASRLYKLISRGHDETGDDASTASRSIGEEPAPLGQVASGVVRRLSEMTGFGEAGAWGVQAAADIRAYAEGKLAWSEVDRGCSSPDRPGAGKTTFAKAFALECGPGVDLVTTTYTEWSAAGSATATA